MVWIIGYICYNVLLKLCYRYYRVGKLKRNEEEQEEEEEEEVKVL